MDTILVHIRKNRLINSFVFENKKFFDVFLYAESESNHKNDLSL